MQKPRSMRALEELGRVRLSENFFMRDFLHSEIANFYGMQIVPDDPDLAIAAGTKLCEEALEPLCLERGVGVINFYALAAGFLTGKYRTAEDASKSKRGASTTGKYLNPRGLRILDALDAAAQEHGATPGQIAIAWQIARPSITAPIASATSLEQLEELRKAATLKLDAQTIARLDAASAED